MLFSTLVVETGLKTCVKASGVIGESSYSFHIVQELEKKREIRCAVYCKPFKITTYVNGGQIAAREPHVARRFFVCCSSG